MAEAFALSASIAGLVSLTEAVFRLTVRFSREVKDAKKDIERFSAEIRHLMLLLYDLTSLARLLEDDTEMDNSFRLYHLNSCQQTVGEVNARLTKAAAATKLKWPFTSKEVDKLLEDTKQHKATISLALGADSIKSLMRVLSAQKDLQGELSEVKNVLKEIRTRILVDKHCECVLNFFMQYNPQPHLEISLRLRHPLTGLWFTEGDIFKSWLHSPSSKLWLSGIPGAGKTVLAGSIIEGAINTSQQGSTASCFFFCDYKSVETQNPIIVLSSLASQLARQDSRAFAILDDYYQQLHPDKRSSNSLSITELSNRLVAMAKIFNRVYLVVDALDECGTSSALTEELVGLVNQAPSISIALLSRDEVHIRDHLEPLQHIEIAAQSGDVQLYVRAELEERIQKRKLRLNKESFKEEIIQALIDGAKGM
ncbi:hypothetical protein BJY04DRAFT_217008 [Aspergillus karnatakaensis]|uniref:uncharacterized protein n=1 Tax=Aspergillus karnatakaensis TaxID=1810916 RepID=UPI003CCCB15F